MFDNNYQIELQNIIYHIKEIKLLIVIHQQNKLWILNWRKNNLNLKKINFYHIINNLTYLFNK